MTSEALYERYKDALKRGHVASLRGRIEDALAAYAEAAAIAPERSTPHTSAGTALLGIRRPADALRHYDAALRISARDEAALLGRAQALATLGRRADAADAFDALAESLALSGKAADAVDAARRGLELAEGRDRRRTLERLIRQLRATEPDESGGLALERALQVLEGHAVSLGTAPAAGLPVAGESTAVAGAPDQEPDGRIELGRVPGEGQAPEPPPEPEPEPAYRRALDRDLAPGADAAALAIRAEAAVDARIAGPALDSLMDLAAAYRRDGQIDGAMDACYLALSFDPDDAGLHLALVELYDERGWTSLATDKLNLVAKLAELDGNADVVSRVAAARNDRG